MAISCSLLLPLDGLGPGVAGAPPEDAAAATDSTAMGGDSGSDAEPNDAVATDAIADADAGLPGAPYDSVAAFPNWGFEVSGDGCGRGWLAAGALAANRVAGKVGAACRLCLADGGSGTFLTEPIRRVAPGSYSLTFEYRTEGDDAGTFTAKAVVRFFDFLDGGPSTESSSNLPSSSSWRQGSTGYPGERQFVRAGVSLSGSADRCLIIDEVVLEEP